MPYLFLIALSPVAIIAGYAVSRLRAMSRKAKALRRLYDWPPAA